MSRKALNLIEISKYGIRTPSGFFLDETHYREAVQPIRGELIKWSRDSNAIRAIFSTIEMPSCTVAALNEGLSNIPSDSNLAVRSSGFIVTNGRLVAEDSQEVSLAGQFESFLNVPMQDAKDAVVQCWASLFNERSLHSFEVGEHYIDNSAMTVLVQEMVPATASAVVMTVDPLSDGTIGGIELAIGPCAVIVDGSICPDEVTFLREDGRILERVVGRKEFALEYDPFTRGASNSKKRALPDDVRNRLAVSDEVLNKIIALSLEIESIFGMPQDIELVVDAKAEITIVQARPMTRLPKEFTHLADKKQLNTQEEKQHA